MMIFGVCLTRNIYIHYQNLIVVDDVATTGATLHEAAKTLYKAGAAKVLCVAFAGNRAVKNAEPF